SGSLSASMRLKRRFQILLTRGVKCCHQTRYDHQPLWCWSNIVGPRALCTGRASGLGTRNIQNGTTHTLFGMDLTVCSKPLTLDSTTLIFSLVLPGTLLMSAGQHHESHVIGWRHHFLMQLRRGESDLPARPC